jgi:hypothetical protein
MATAKNITIWSILSLALRESSGVRKVTTPPLPLVTPYFPAKCIQISDGNNDTNNENHTEAGTCATSFHVPQGV